MCMYYTLDFHGCGCRLRCPSKLPVRCPDLNSRKKCGKFQQHFFERMHRRNCMFLTWETSKLKCPHCRVFDKFSPKNYNRARKEGLWVGNKGKVDMKLLEKNGERGSTDGTKVWGKTKTNGLEMLYDTETQICEPATSRPAKKSRNAAVQPSLDTILEEFSRMSVD